MTKRTWGVVLAALAIMTLIFTYSSAPTPLEAQTQLWQVTYYNSNNLTGAAVGPFSYPQPLNLNFASTPLQSDAVTPIPGIGADNFSASGQLVELFAAGTYQFTGSVDDRIVITIDDIEVFRDDQPGPTPISFQRALTAGQHVIKFQWIEFQQQATLTLSYSLVGAGGPVFTPTPSGPTAQVVNVRGLSLRTGPYLGASFIAVLRPNIQYSVNARSADEGGPFTWYRVRAGDREGWASGRYLTVNLPEQIPAATSVFETLNTTQVTGTLGVTRAIMNVRRRPSIRSQRVDQIPWGAEVQLLHRTVQGGENFWFHIRYGDGKTGWIYAPFVSVRGFIEAVPII